VVDVKLHTKSRRVIHIEIHLKVTSAFKGRIVFYISKMITEQLESGDEYDQVNPVVSIVITNETFVAGSPRYHHRFVWYDIDAQVQLTDLEEIHTIELNKLPEQPDNTALYDWASFIAAETEEELTMLAERNPQIAEATVKLIALSGDAQARDMLERRLKGMRDYNMSMKEAKNEGLSEGRAEGRAEGLSNVARKMLKRNRPIEEIMEDTGLTRAEIEAL
jgi:predicted transposase/invertase (TIGR01784 family)